ncbi:hypothetical protein ACFRFU_42325 [Streptomyces sp. NPDC056704]|uniref:hypothetical protein n=1 Tax=Streptomyces TaxID=1883 RepID=UPI00367BC5B8
MGCRVARVAVLSAGSWGTTLAKVFADAGSDVTIHARRPEVVAERKSESPATLPVGGATPHAGTAPAPASPPPTSRAPRCPRDRYASSPGRDGTRPGLSTCVVVKGGRLRGERRLPLPRHGRPGHHPRRDGHRQPRRQTHPAPVRPAPSIDGPPPGLC